MSKYNLKIHKEKSRIIEIFNEGVGSSSDLNFWVKNKGLSFSPNLKIKRFDEEFGIISLESSLDNISEIDDFVYYYKSLNCYIPERGYLFQVRFKEKRNNVLTLIYQILLLRLTDELKKDSS